MSEDLNREGPGVPRGRPTDRPGSESPDTRILVVEDDHHDAADLARLLETMGYTVPARLGTGEDAVAWLEDHDADLVLMDIRLGGRMSGIEAAARARDLHDVAVVYVSAHADKSTLAEAKETEPYGYVVKPFRETELESAIEVALYRHRIERERRALEERLRQSQKLEGLGRLAGGIAHDFNNLLTGILGNAELALEELSAGEPSLPEVQESLRGIVALGERAAGLVGQLLTFSRGRPGTERATVSLDGLIERMADLLGPLTGEAIRLDVDIEDGTHAVDGNESQLQQVIENLVLNARDAMQGGGTISIQLGAATLDGSSGPPAAGLAPGRYVVVTVRDDGAGMDEETRQRIFDPFFSRRRENGGAGLGLSLAHGIVQEHGGAIDVESAPDRGSVFRVYLPGAAEPVPAASEAEAVPGNSETETVRTASEPEPRQPRSECRETVLVVDDEPSVLALVRRMLEHRGYRVLVAADAARALDLLESEGGVDLILTDVVLPGPSGPEMIGGLPEKWRSIPVLYMSGYTGGDWLPPGMPDATAMPEPLIAKPFDTATLTAMIRQLIERRG